MLREHSFDAGVVAINYAADAGAGPPMVLIHGVMGRWQGWLPVLADLGVRWRRFALDLRGHGRSGHAGGAYRITDYAGDVIAFLRAQAGEPAVLVGHSLGAIIAIAVAAEAPDLVRAVVLEDPPLAAFRHERLRDRAEYARFSASRDLAASGRAVEEIAAALATLQPGQDAVALRSRAVSLHHLDPEVVTMVLDDRAKEGYDLDALLGRIACPVLLLQGNPAHGGALRDVDAARAAGQLARGTHVYLPDVGHGIHAADGQPRAFARLVLDFLETL